MKRNYIYIISGFAVLAVLAVILFYTCHLSPVSSGTESRNGETGSISNDNIEKTVPQTEATNKPVMKPSKTRKQNKPKPPKKKDPVIPAELFTLLMEYGGHHYYISRNKSTWKEAFAICQQYGGHLVTITSDTENRAVLEAVKLKDIRNDILIGFTDEKKEGQWEWVTGEKSGFTYWDVGQPDNYNGDENYAVIWQEDHANKIRYRWNDASGKNTITLFILEKE